jgi:hypothetical protein
MNPPPRAEFPQVHAAASEAEKRERINTTMHTTLHQNGAGPQRSLLRPPPREPELRGLVEKSQKGQPTRRGTSFYLD